MPQSISLDGGKLVVPIDVIAAVTFDRDHDVEMNFVEINLRYEFGREKVTRYRIYGESEIESVKKAFEHSKVSEKTERLERIATQLMASLVIESRIAWTADRDIDVCFEDLAAESVRAADRVGAEKLPKWIGTFHGICARLLRLDIEDLEGIGISRSKRFATSSERAF